MCTSKIKEYYYNVIFYHYMFYFCLDIRERLKLHS